MNVLIIHGPNLNLLGTREKNIYGDKTLEEINEILQNEAKKYKIKLKIFQSNFEGEIIDFIHKHSDWANTLIINPGAYTHTSIAIRDAILGTGISTIEIHLSNIYKREDFRQISFISDIAKGTIAGFGYYGYILALMAAINSK